MPLPLEERKQKHFEFMCAALNGLIASSKGPVESSLYASGALLVADAALAEYEKRWEGET